MTDTIELLGKLIEGDAGRDAVHIAVAPVMSVHDLGFAPAQGLIFAYPDDTERVKGCGKERPIGIVDPFLDGYVMKGQRFWMFLMPATITSLRHVWTHPAFVEASSPPVSDKKVASEAWLSDWLHRQGDNPGYAVVMQTIKDGSWNEGQYNSGRLEKEYLHFSGTDAHGEIPDEFWDHVEVVLGHKPKHRPSYFSCSC